MSDCPNCDANKKAADQLMDELLEAIGKYKTRQGLIEFLIEQHDIDQIRILRTERDNAALRADIAAMQSGEMTI